MCSRLCGRPTGGLGGDAGHEPGIHLRQLAERRRLCRLDLLEHERVYDLTARRFTPRGAKGCKERRNLGVRLAADGGPGPENRMRLRGLVEQPREPVEQQLLELIAVGEPRRAIVGRPRRRPRRLGKIVGGVGHGLADRAVVHGRLVGGDGGLEFHEFRGKGLGLRADRIVADDGEQFWGDAAGENAVEGVIIGGRHRLVFMVVAAGAGDGKPQQAAGHQIDPVVDDVVRVADKRAADREEAECRQIAGRPRRIDPVGCELERDEPVVWHVAVQRIDDPVAIGPCERIPGVLIVEGIAHRVGIAGEVEPLAGPVLGMGGGGEQPVGSRTQGRVDGGRAARRGPAEGIGFIGRRRQAGEVVEQPADQVAGGRLRRGCESGVVESGGDEVVDDGDRPGVAEWRRERCGQFGGRMPLWGCKCPVALERRGEPFVHGGGWSRLRGVAVTARAAPGGAGRYPGLERGDLVGREFLVGRHRHVIRMPHGGQ